MTPTLSLPLARAARDAWDVAVKVERAPYDAASYRASLQCLDSVWRAAALPLPWYPSMIARGMQERRP